MSRNSGSREYIFPPFPYSVNGFAVPNESSPRRRVGKDTPAILLGQHGRLPSLFAITDKVEVSDEIPVSGDFADFKLGVHWTRVAQVKLLRVLSRGDMEKTRNVSNSLFWNGYLTVRASHPAVLQERHSSEFIVPLERLNTP